MRASIISSAAGSTPPAIVPVTVAAAASIESKAHSIVATAGGFGREPHRDPRRDAHRALRADEAAPEVVAGLVGREAAEPGDGAVGEHDVDREHVRRRDARREAVRAAGVGRDVAADRAGLLRRRIGRVVQARGATTARVRSRLSTPGSTHATRACGSTSRTRFIWVVTITSGSSSGVAPPASPVPLPRATNGRPWRRAMRTAAATSSADRGQHTATALPSLTPASRRVQRELERLGARTGRDRAPRADRRGARREVRCTRGLRRAASQVRYARRPR